ncbi:DEKNAAC102645 [Brettanomyces naardenensis]|uniref:Genetic interactor of prohibitins 3, mitochondrial n=1 Tax=Brettanomyces naardenensis TaxID=13370 RepID=A0A448YKL0_BRENA|nr:DEKNAAC102645 [Brettanomyces naardenensis]
MRDTSIHKDEKQVLDIIPATLDDVMGTMPRNSDTGIIYCLSARDFPLSLAKRFFRLLKLRGLNISKVYFVVTLLDNITDDLNTEGIAKYRDYYTRSLQTYVEGLSDKMGFRIDPDHVFVISDKVQKPMTDLYESLPLHSSTYYVIGETNSGKSKLSKRFMKLVMKEEKSVQQVEGTPGESIDGEAFNLNSNANSSYTISPCPFRTRKNMTYYAPQFDFRLIDTPGYLQKRNGIFGILNRRLRLNLYTQFQADRTQQEVIFESPTTRQVFTVGDFFFLKPRGVTAFKYRRFMYGKAAVFPEYSEATFKLARAERFVTPKFRRYVIPPFRGKIDLVFDNVGYIEIDNCYGDGSEYWQIFAPQNVKKILRIPSLDDAMSTGYKSDFAPLQEIPMTVNVQDYIDEHGEQLGCIN